ncbi:Clp protease N-terminal domain-containing protein, partial [Nocardia brasiliensis]|uniref:Clp protease N-terminal domain-containing protein n=1 Tax=Nocardia brasiliensis TaxID=37326 RepID=UPI0032AF3A07
SFIFSGVVLAGAAPAPAVRSPRPPRNFGHIPFTKDAKKVLELSLREALARKDKSIESGHVLLGILRAPNPTTERLLGGSGPIDELRSKVHTLLDRAA